MGEDNVVQQTVQPPVEPTESAQATANNAANIDATPADESSSTGQQGTESKRFEEDTGSYQLVVDPNGNRSLKFVETNAEPTNEGAATEPETPELPENTEGETTTAGEIAENVSQQLNQEPEPYTLDELTAAIGAGNIDERRVPTEYKQQVAAIRIQQAQATYNAQVEAARKQEQEALAKQQLTPEQQREQQRVFLQNLEQEASQRAAQDAGLTADEVQNLDLLDDNDPRLINYKLAKQWHREDITRTLQNKYNEENTARQKQAAVYQGINAFIADARTSEPNFDAIDKFMTDRVTNLPYKEASRLIPVFEAFKQGTITESQAVELRMYYERSRKDYYAAKNNLSTKPRRAATPPVTERPGNGETVQKKYVPDYNALRNGNNRDRIQWIADFLSHSKNQ